MTSTEPTGGNAAQNTDAARDSGMPPALASAMDQLWIRFLPEIRKRVDVLEAASAAFTARGLSAELRVSAHGAAHKLAGTLGTFSLARGTEVAREFEVLFEKDGGPDGSLAGRLTAMARELRSIVESRG